MENLTKVESIEVPTLSVEEWEKFLDEREEKNERRREILELMKQQVAIIDSLHSKSSLSGELSEEEWEDFDNAMSMYESLEKDYLSI